MSGIEAFFVAVWAIWLSLSIVYSFLEDSFDFGDTLFFILWFGVFFPIVVGIPLAIYSRENTQVYPTYSQPAEILSKVEVPDGIIVYYIGFDKKAYDHKFTMYQDVAALKNGGVLHIKTMHGTVYFGPDKNETKLTIETNEN